ncbi:MULTISPECIES: branched-chain amino acid ABC transporter substrate-binding protein [unclassified Ochrobactrum]|uniref:branched-chain amino acid ABC transporter substrate-binding protein n=1 Tax=unclassified Ochrobactrum TaxID=239106 RepID=UPI000DEF7F89|nr:branched-chain amino acid ABC transporter substrate-binding protein [Ochrobactrum sp. 3-3]MBQ0708613.1 branched-chain amino acid ABC transporter substrate-binding protein [Ochrobactrum sp. AP1BH01-1]
MIELGKRPAAALTSIILTLLTSSVLAQAEHMRIGLAAPLSGTFAPLGNQLAEGARIAATAKGAELVISDDRCDAEGGKEAAERFVKENVRVATGFLCPEALEAALPVLAAVNIPVVASGVSEPTLTERRAPAPMAVFRLATSLDKETQATGSFLGSLWRAQPFAVIDDGTIEGRERAARVLASLKEQQLQPVFTDTYRPGLDNQNALVARLRRAGATHVYVGGERDDIAAIGASAAALNHPLTIAGGSLLEAAPGAQPLGQDTLMIAPIRPQDLSTAKPANDALHQAGKLADAHAIIGYASAEIAADVIRRAEEKKQPIIDTLRNGSFETVLGTMKFDGNGIRTDNPNRLQRFDGKRFVLADK